MLFYEGEPAGDVIFCTGSRMHIDFTLALRSGGSWDLLIWRIEALLLRGRRMLMQRDQGKKN